MTFARLSSQLWPVERSSCVQEAHLVAIGLPSQPFGARQSARLTKRPANMVTLHAMRVLVAKSGPLEGNSFPIGVRTVIGRDSDCDIQVIDRGISRKHACVIVQDDGSVLVRDLRSQNGTMVGGERVVEAVLALGDEIGIGDSRFVFAFDEDYERRSEIEIKLVSGPATASTVSATLTQDDREEIMARVRASRAAQTTKADPEPPPAQEPPQAKPCCGSPLAREARAQHWKYCPACGSDLTV